MTLNSKGAVRILAVVLMLTASLSAAAQGDWRFSVTPSVWGPALGGNIRIGPKSEFSLIPPDEPIQTIRVTYSDALGATDIGGAVTLEGHNGYVGFIVDGLYLSTPDGAEPPGAIFDRADVDLKQSIVMFTGTYRLAPERVRVELLAGVRYFDVDVEVDLIMNGDVSDSAAQSADWLDAMIGARVQFDISKSWGFLGHFDIGGGESDLSYQAIVGFDYEFSPAVSAEIGYRLLSTDYTPELFIYNMRSAGLYAGCGFHW